MQSKLHLNSCECAYVSNRLFQLQREKCVDV